MLSSWLQELYLPPRRVFVLQTLHKGLQLVGSQMMNASLSLSLSLNPGVVELLVTNAANRAHNCGVGYETKM